jgi:hypothetical protein
MAKPTQYTISLREAATTLVKAAGIKEGKWMLAFNFSFGAGNLGESEDSTRPGGFVMINQMLLSRQPDDAPDLPFIVDAAQLHAEEKT